MATYNELRDLFSDSTLVGRMQVAVVIAAHGLLAGAPLADDRAWAASVLENPRVAAEQALLFALAANKDNSVAQIQGATDAVLQTAVDAVVPELVSAKAGV